jgi:hypothetical protein
MLSIGLSAAAFVLAFLPFRAPAQEPQTQDPPPEEEVTETDEQELDSDEQITIDEMKELSDEDLRVLYLDTPWLLPENFGEDAELLERVMSIVHPETETETETEGTESTQTTPKPKPKPDAR